MSTIPELPRTLETFPPPAAQRPAAPALDSTCFLPELWRSARLRCRLICWTVFSAFALAATVITAWPAFDTEFLLYVALLIGILLLALGAALMARNFDSRIRCAADLDRVLGLAPIAQFPDLGDVPPEQADDAFRELAALIARVSEPSPLRRFVVTGVAQGAGASTVAAGIVRALQGMGRSAVLVDASSTPSLPRERLTEQIVDSMGGGTIVLCDTPPLLASRETQYLAQFVDSVIVVIQSGLTTRAQLRQIAHSCARLEVSAVRFVLNRVANQEPSSRPQANEDEQHPGMRHRLPPGWPSNLHQGDSAREQSVVNESEPVKQPDENPDSTPPVDAPGGQGAHRNAAPRGLEPKPSPRVTRGRGEPARSTAGPRPPKSAPAPRHPHPFAPPPGQVAPEAPSHARAPQPAHPSAPAPAAEDASQSSITAPPVPPPLPPGEPAPADLAIEHGDNSYVPSSRLSGLRNLLVTLGRRSLNRDHATAEDANTDIEPRFERATVRPAYPDEHPGDASEMAAPAHLTAQPEFLRPKTSPEADKPEKEKEEKEVMVRPTPPRRENQDPDEIQTLPSWRGQYRKKRYPPL